MNGRQRQLIDQAIAEAFTQAELARALLYELDVKLPAVVPANLPLVDLAFELCNWAEREGRMGELVRALREARPRNEKLCQAFVIDQSAPIGELQQGGKAISAPPQLAEARAGHNAGLERLVKANIPQVDIQTLVSGVADAESRVCRIDRDGVGLGTGFLVARNLVMTNFHVMKEAIGGGETHERYTCRFDYKKLDNGATHQGQVLALDPINWLVDHSEPTPEEIANRPDDSVPTGDQLDYALLRLAADIGAQPRLTAGVQGSATPRGWFVIPLTGQAPLLPAHSPLIIVQHPNRDPMKVAIDTDAVLRDNANGTRVRYSTNTEAGSSGSPCFTIEWRLAALHHYGDPARSAAKFNQGVPIGLIRQRLENKGVANLLGV